MSILYSSQTYNRVPHCLLICDDAAIPWEIFGQFLQVANGVFSPSQMLITAGKAGGQHSASLSPEAGKNLLYF